MQCSGVHVHVFMCSCVRMWVHGCFCCVTQEYAAALQALCAMVMDHPHNTAAFCSHKELAPAISLLLGARSDPLKCTYEDATLVLAAHSLVIVLGHMAANGGQVRSHTSTQTQTSALAGIHACKSWHAACTTTHPKPSSACIESQLYNRVCGPCLHDL